MPKDNKSTKVKIPSKAPELGASAIKRGVSDDFTPRSNRTDSADIDSALDAAGVFDQSDDAGAAPDNGKEVEAGAPPPVVGKEDAAPEAGKAPPVEKPEAKAPPVGDKKPALGETDAEKEAKKLADEAGKKAPKTDPKAPTAPAVADPKAAEHKDEEVDKVEAPKNMSPGAKENWDKLAKLAKERGTKEKEWRGKYEEAVTDINKLFKEKGKLPEDVEKELKDLRSFKKLHDFENDPDFKKQYSDKLSENDKTIETILLQNGMPQATLDTLKAKGFSNIPKSHWDEKVFGPLEKAGSPEELQAAAVIKNLLEKNLVINHDMKQEIKKAGEGKSEYWNNISKAKETEQAEEKTFVEKEVNTLMEKYPFLKPQEVPANATPEQKEAINKANQYVGFLHGKFQEHYRPKNTGERLNTAVAAVYAYIAEDQFVAMQQKYNAEKEQWDTEKAQLEQQLEEIKKAGMTSDAGESTPPKPAGINPMDNFKKKNVDAIEDGLAASEASLR